MLGFSLPANLLPITRYGLMLGDQHVSFVSWKGGKFNLLGEFGNDTQGLTDFAAFLKDRGNTFKGKTISVVVSVVGEDYRFERVAHLVGKYRSDMLARKVEQMFRGATYHVSTFQGREPVGRRQDMFLFCGILSNDKVQPWIRDLTRSGFNVSGVHLASMATQSVLKAITKDTQGVHIVTLVGKSGSLRHNFFIDGHMRFSRLSRVPEDGGPEDMYRAVRTEVEKTSAYLVSIKLVQQTTKFMIHVLCADHLVDGVNEIAARNAGDRFTVSASSARIVGTALGVKNPMEEFGRDSTLVMHETLRTFRISQLAPFADVRYYFALMTSRILSVGVVAWAAFNLLGIGGNALSSFSQYTSANSDLEVSIAQLKENYANQVEGFGVPPSSPNNMRAAVNVLDNAADGRGVGPGKLMLFLSKLLENSRSIQLEEFNWYISNDTAAPTGEYSFANGKKVYEVIEVSGFLDPDVNSEFAYNQYIAFVESIKSRPDMTVVEKVSPSLLEAGGELVVEIDELSDIRSELNAFTNNKFLVAVAWEPTRSAQPN